MNPAQMTHDFGAAILVLIALWAVAGVIRYPKETADAARTARAATNAGLDRFARLGEGPAAGSAPGAARTATDPGVPSGVGPTWVHPGHVAAELGVRALAFTAGLAAGAGYAVGGDLVRAIQRRAHRPALAPDPAEGPLYAPDDPNVVDGDVVSDTPTPDPTLGGIAPAATGDGIEDAEIVPDTSTTPADQAPTDPKGNPVTDLPDITPPDLPSATAPAVTLGQAKRDLNGAIDAGATVSTWAGTQVGVSEARITSAQARANGAAAIAEVGARAAHLAAASAEAGAVLGVDESSTSGQAAVGAQGGTLSRAAAAAAEAVAEELAAAVRSAEAFARLDAEAQAFAAVAADARSTLAAHQDPHATAVQATGHGGAHETYYADAGA